MAWCRGGGGGLGARGSSGVFRRLFFLGGGGGLGLRGLSCRVRAYNRILQFSWQFFFGFSGLGFRFWVEYL